MKVLIFIGLKLIEIIGVVATFVILAIVGNYFGWLFIHILEYLGASVVAIHAPYVVISLLGIFGLLLCILLSYLIVMALIEWYKRNIELTNKIYNKYFKK